jgi:hypothetical protein
MTTYTPSAEHDLSRIKKLLLDSIPFSFIRFSDGEMEILRDRYLHISPGKTVFKGRTFDNSLPIYDSKTYDPKRHKSLRRDLLASAMLRKNLFFKGVPANHNNLLADREFMVRLNGGMSEFITFSDLFMNSNYISFLEQIVPLFADFKNLLVIANNRAVMLGDISHASHIQIGDNVFERYEETLNNVMDQVIGCPAGSVILSSASSLSNIVGFKLNMVRDDLTFIDMGTAINHLLALESKTRAYHSREFNISGIKNRLSSNFKIRW